MNRATPLALSLCLLLAACAPTTVQGPGGPQSVNVIGGTLYALSSKVPVENLTPQTPDDAAITFRDCQGGAVRAGDVRRVGPEVALKACQQAVQRSADIQNGAQIAGFVLAPLAFFVGYQVFRFLNCITGTCSY